VLGKRSELELKLLVPADFQLPPLANGAGGVATATEREPLQLSAVYFDTQDLRLMRCGITLRYRLGDDDGPVWTLKLPVNQDKAQRSELEFTGDGSEPPAEARALLLGVLNGSSLVPVAEIKTRRRRWDLASADGRDLAQLVDDRVSVLDGNEIRDSFREIEIEAHTADRSQLKEIADVIRDAGAIPEQRSKASRALEAIRGAAAGAADAVVVGPDDPAGKAVAPALSRALDRLLSSDPYARLGEVEGVHQLRVAGRRLRSVLRTFAPLLDEEKTARAHEELRWFGRVLGDVRDLDVLTENLREHSRDLAEPLAPVFAALAERHEAKKSALADALSSERYSAMIEMLRSLVADPGMLRTPGSRVEAELPALATRMWQKLDKFADGLTADSAESDFHRARILAKRARYAAETISEFVPPKLSKRIRPFAEDAESLQNILGEHQDATYARNVLIEFAPQPDFSTPATSFALGRMVERYDNLAARKRREFFKLWRKLGRSRARK
jgi:CHAD domain-containing protein